MDTPYRIETLYSERYHKSDLYRFMRSQALSEGLGVIVPLNQSGSRACMMIDSPTRRGTMVSTGWSNQFLVIPAFHWRLIAMKNQLSIIEADEIPPSLEPSHLYHVARRALRAHTSRLEAVT
jgi:hypothetical protein